MSHAHIVVIGNQKGGSGKSTTSMHLIVSLLNAGYTVGSIDLDDPQATLTRYLENRRHFIAAQGAQLALPDHQLVKKSIYDNPGIAQNDERTRFDAAIAKLSVANDFVVVDTPGSDSFLSRHGHSYADTLITPMNDSFIDLDLLAKVEPETYRILYPSAYAEMVWEQKKARALRDGGQIDWIVMRNRLATIGSRNTRAMEEVLAALAKRIGFRLAPGFGERVIFRELFLKGLTLLDMRNSEAGIRLNMSHVAARQEVRALLGTIGLAQAPSFGVASAAAGTQLI
ncbi:MAG: division plane positioning ATPase MipZ [Alphaproteobacteria bacterium]|nr:division plane positioning ATPase MipZ [Alphaproteobacteria bacterium]